MKITFDTKNVEEVREVLTLLTGCSHESSTVEPEDTKEPEVIPESPKEKKAPEKAKKAPAKSEIKLVDLKESAKNAVTRSSREDVKKAIANYAEKLAEVSEEDYGKLYKTLQELGA